METVIEWYLNGPTWQVFLAALGTLWFVGAIVRALWRWVARRRKAPTTCPVCGHHKAPVGFADWEPWNKSASSCELRYTCRCCGAEVWHEVAHDGKRAGWRCAPCVPEPDPAPDLKYQGDQVTSLRKEFLALEERVGKLEGKAKSNPPCIPDSYAKMEETTEYTGPVQDQFGRKTIRTRTDMSYMETPSWLSIKPAPATKYRVFRGIGRCYNVCVDGIEVARRADADAWYPPAPVWTAEQFAKDSVWTELAQDSPEYRDIVASFEAWRKGQ